MIQLTSPPEYVAIRQNGEIIGLFNEIRESVQGNTFWESQVKAIKSDLDFELSEPQRQADLDNEIRQWQLEEKKDLAAFYLEHPDMKPTAAALMAEALRERADQIEQQELDRQLEELRLERIEELRIILQVAKDKLN